MTALAIICCLAQPPTADAAAVAKMSAALSHALVTWQAQPTDCHKRQQPMPGLWLPMVCR